MQVVIYSFSRAKERFLQEAEAHYQKRIRPFVRLEIQQLSLRRTSSSEPDRGKASLVELKKHLKANDYVIVLDEDGELSSSREVAETIEQQMQNGVRRLVFAIGGPEGWKKEELQKESWHILSLSPLTFTAQFSRLLLLEQLYRSYTILGGLPYHNG